MCRCYSDLEDNSSLREHVTHFPACHLFILLFIITVKCLVNITTYNYKRKPTFAIDRLFLTYNELQAVLSHLFDCLCWEAPLLPRSLKETSRCDLSLFPPSTPPLPHLTLGQIDGMIHLFKALIHGCYLMWVIAPL